MRSRIYGVSSNVTLPYVYRITNTKTGMHYYGKRVANKLQPQLDLGSHYFGSTKDQNFRNDQKQNSQDYKYKVVRVFESADAAGVFEELLLGKFDAARHEMFYNLSNGGPHLSFGISPAICVNTNTYIGLISTDDPRWSTGEICGVSVGYAPALCVASGELIPRVSIDDPRWTTKEIVGATSTIINITDGVDSRIYIPDGTDTIPDGWWITRCKMKSGTRLIDIYDTNNVMLYRSVVASKFAERFGFHRQSLLECARMNEETERQSNYKGMVVRFSNVASSEFPANKQPDGPLRQSNVTEIWISDGNAERKYNPDGTDTIPDGWSIVRGRINKNSKLLNVYDVKTGELIHTNIIASLFGERFNIGQSNISSCARKNSKNDGITYTCGNFVFRNVDSQRIQGKVSTSSSSVVIWIGNGVNEREYIPDGTDTIPDGWWITKSRIPKGSRLINIYDMNTRNILYSNVIANRIAERLNITQSELSRCANNNSNGGGTHNVRGLIVMFADESQEISGEIVGGDLIKITDGVNEREYIPDGTDTIPDGWWISMRILSRGTKLLNIYDCDGKLLYGNVVASRFVKNFKQYRKDGLIKCARKNSKNDGKIYKYNGIIVRDV